MFKSVVTKLTFLGAVVVPASVLAASVANAGLINPCVRTGPHIVESSASGYPTINGSCFLPGDAISVWFVGNGNIVPAQPEPNASPNGTFSVLVQYAGYNSSETVEAYDFAANEHSNTLTIPEPWVD